MVLKTLQIKDMDLNRRYSFNPSDISPKLVKQAIDIRELQRRNSLNAADFAKAKPTEHKWWHFISGTKASEAIHTCNSVATQKLRESKWFKADEERLFCAVIESGFIVEVTNGHSTDNSKNWYGIVSVEAKKSKKATAADIFIYTVKKEMGRHKIIKIAVASIWQQDNKLRINNLNDKNKAPNGEKDIKSQIQYALKTKMNFHNSLHFVEYSRYGEKVEARKRQVSDSVKWGTVGMNAGLFLVMQREKSHSASACH